MNRSISILEHRRLVLDQVTGSVWHTTSSARFKDILKSGSILAEPGIADKARWGTARGRVFYPYVRSLRGVSLFDFSEFDAESYSAAYPTSSWATFVPYQSQWKEAVWIEIDTMRLSESYVCGTALLARWKADKATNRIMPMIESAALAPIPALAFKRAFGVNHRLPELTVLL
jgi:hypothetical protein